MKKVLLFSMLVLAFVGAQAQATITIPWQTNAYGTHQFWDDSPDALGLYEVSNVVPDLDENPFGTPTATVVFGAGDTGSYDYIELFIPNTFHADLVKIVQLETIFSGSVTGHNLTATDVDVTKFSEGLVEVTSGVFKENISWRITPQPATETIRIQWDHGNPVTFQSLEVATVCVPVPVPGAMLLAGMGTALIGWLRRKRFV